MGYSAIAKFQQFPQGDDCVKGMTVFVGKPSKSRSWSAFAATECWCWYYYRCQTR